MSPTAVKTFVASWGIEHELIFIDRIGTWSGKCLSSRVELLTGYLSAQSSRCSGFTPREMTTIRQHAEKARLDAIQKLLRTEPEAA